MKPKSGGQRGRHRRPEESFTFEEADDRLYDLFRNHGFETTPHEVRHQLVQYYQLLMDSQKQENFTRLLTLREVGIKHFIDCLMIPQLTKLTFPLLDVGTGPGLPGIPLKVLFPEERILLGEGVQRRVEFLKTVREKMQLKNLDIIGRNITPDFHLPVKGVITRAVEDIQNTMKNVMYCLEPKGRLFLMKGPNVDPEMEEAEKSFGEYYRLLKDIPYTLPQTPHERRLLVYEKIKMAPIAEKTPAEEDETW